MHYRYFSNVSVLFRNTAFQKMLNVMQHTQRNETQSVWEWERQNMIHNVLEYYQLFDQQKCMLKVQFEKDYQSVITCFMCIVH